MWVKHYLTIVNPHYVTVVDNSMNIDILTQVIINHQLGNGLYHLFMVMWGMVYGIVLPAVVEFIGAINETIRKHYFV